MRRPQVSPQRANRTKIIVGIIGVFVGAEILAHRSEHEIAGASIVLAATALLWTIFLSATLDNKVERIERDVRNIAAVTSQPMFHYGLRDENGGDLGLFATSEPNWKPGHRIHRGNDALEVIRIVDAEDGDTVNGYLVVKKHY
jgi:hypothetical protein